MDRLTSRLEQLRDRRVKDSVNPKQEAAQRRRGRGRRRTALSRLLKELKGLPRWCFGGRRLLRQRRIREWRRRRDSQALFCGERGKRAGNEVAIWCPPPPDGMASMGAAARSGASAPKHLPGGRLRLRLPNDCARKYLTLDGFAVHGDGAVHPRLGGGVQGPCHVAREAAAPGQGAALGHGGGGGERCLL